MNPDASLPVGKDCIDPRTRVLEIPGAADERWRHIGPAQRIRVSNIRKENGMASEDVRERQIPPALVFIQLGPNRILGLQRLVDGVVDRMLVPVSINGKPVPAAGIEADAAALDFDAHVPKIRVTDDEVGFAILGLLFLAAQDPPDLEEDDKVTVKPVPQSPVDLRLRLGRQLCELGIGQFRNDCCHRLLQPPSSSANST